MSLTLSSLFKRKTLKLTEPTTTLKGQYLGNVSTNVAKGESCIERPMTLLWSNYVKTSGKQTVSMKITVDNSGLKVFTTNQGLTHYWCHRVSYFCVPKSNSKLFVWIYRHVGKKLKVELRCHAILLANEKKAKSLVELLTDKVAASLQEYRREKNLKQRRRLLHEKAEAYLTSQGESPSQARTKLLATSKNYKPPTEYSLTSPTLTAISEEVDGSSSDESDYNGGSPYSTLGRWTFKNKFRDTGSTDSTPDVNMNQVLEDGECDSLTEYRDVSGFATLPRNHRPRSKRDIEKKLLVDRLDRIALSRSEDTPITESDTPITQNDTPLCDWQLNDEDSGDDYEVEPGVLLENGGEEEDNDSGAGSQSLSGAANAKTTNQEIKSEFDQDQIIPRTLRARKAL